jgi:O-antigen/teichoic acid export membrane protein
LTRARSRVFSEGSLTKKASLNSVATALNQGARAIVGFVVNPLLLRYLGDVTFGNWQVVNRLIGQTNPAGGRPSEALKWFIANRHSSDDLQVKRQAVASAIVVWLIFIPILVPVGAVVGWFAPIWLHVPPADYAVVRLTAAVLVAGIVVMGLTNIPWASLAGENLGYKRMGITAAFEFVGGGLMIVAAVSGTGLIGLAAATVAVTLMSGVLYLWLARVYIPWFGVARPDVSAVRRFLGLSWWFLLWNFVTRITMGGDIVVLGIAGSATQVTTYSLTRFIPLTITAGVASVIFGMAPGLGGLIGAGEMVRAARVRSETMAVAWLMATVAGAGVLLWEESFLRLWVGQRYYPGVVPTLLIVLMVLQLTFIRVDSNIIDLTLNIRRKVLLGLLSAALSIGFAWFLVARLDLGIAGVAAGFIAGRAVQSVTYPLMIGRILTIPTSAQVAAIVRAGLVTAGLFGAAAALGPAVTVGTWVSLVVASALSGVVLVAAAVFGGLSEVQRRWLLSRARRVIRLK